MTQPSPQDDQRTDDHLIDAANRGDAGAFDALYYRYRDWVFRLAWRFTGNREDALDVLQETFTYFMRKFPGFYLYARVKTFLYPVVRSTSVNLLRQRRRLVSTDSPLLAAADAEAAQTAGATQGRAELAAVMASLPDAQREVVLMRFVDDLSLEDIAEALQIPLGTVKSRLHNALAALRNDARTRRYFGL